MKNNYNYTKEQKRAIMHGKGPAAVFAGPGSGKTFVLIEHISYLIDTLHIRPQNILVITFTKAAAIQMEERFFRKVNRRLPVVFKTFHAFFYQVLSQSIFHANKKILTVNEKKYILKLIAIEVFPLLENSIELLEEIANCISRRKENREITNEENKIIQIYEEEKFKLGKIDFNDLVCLCYEEFLRNPELLHQIRTQFPYLMIDEFQDITPIQYEIMKLLGDYSKSIFIVGDEDQSIYRFCGSRADSMQQFMKDYNPVTKYILEENFRSSRKIIENAHRLITQNKNRFDKKVISQSKNCGEFDTVVFQTQDKEIQYVIDKICIWGEKEKNKNIQGAMKTIAIIMRTRNSMDQVQMQFIKHNIRLHTKNKIRDFFENQRIKEICAYLNFAKNGHLRDDLFIVLNKPMRYVRTNIFRKDKVDFDEVISYVEEDGIKKESIKKLKMQMDLLSMMSISGAIHFIRVGVGYDVYLKTLANKKNESYDKWFNELNLLEELAKSFSSWSQFVEYIQNYQVKLRSLKQQKMRYDKVLKVEMLTMHAAKGLEFDDVLIMDVNEGNIPHKKALKKEEIEEERRLLYVSITRAREEVYLLYLEEKEKNRHIKSRFIQECIIESKCLNY